MKSILSLFLILAFATTIIAQPPHPRKSPISLAAVAVDGAYMKVVYGAPYINERDIFGGLVPYGQVWRTGANESTEITFTSDVIFGGAEVKAGTYSVFSVPGETEWQIILNKDLGMWGHYTYKDASDLVRVKGVISALDETVDPMRIQLKNEEGTVQFILSWAKTAVTVPITVKK
jgi:hypothetical protein